MMRIFDGRTSFAQWDVNMKIADDSFKVGEKVHIYNGTTKNALVLLAYAYEDTIVVDVPNIFLTARLPITAYRCFEDETCACTVGSATFEVEARPKPDDYVYTQTEVQNYATLEARIEALEDGSVPYIQDGYWYINGKCTDIKAEGVDGYTPQRGVDYFTEEDLAIIDEKIKTECKLISDDVVGLDKRVSENKTAIDEIAREQTEQNTAIQSAIETADDAKRTADTLDNTIQTALTHSVETRTLLTEEVQRAKDAEQTNSAKITALENSKQDNLSFDGVYNKDTNKVATVETVAREVAEGIAQIVADAPEDLNDLKEMSEWLINHGADAAEMNANINANTTDIRKIQTEQTTQNAGIKANADDISAIKEEQKTQNQNIASVTATAEALSISKQNNLAFDDTYNAETNKVATVNTVAREVAKIGAEELNSRISENASAITQIQNEQIEQNGKIEQNTQSASTAQSTADNALTIANSGVTLATTALSISEEARSKANSAVATASEAKEIATEANAKADGLAESKQDNLAFDGEYNAESNKVATVNTVASKVAEIVASAPEDFDTLKEVADYIASDKTGATEINNKLSEHGAKIATNETAIAERVKYSDFATKDTAGVVKVNETYGTRMVSGVLDLMPAQNSIIDSRTPNDYPLYLVNNYTRHMIVPANLDYAVKKALADNKIADTAYAWTDEEKASARELLGAVSDTAGATSSTMGLVTVNSVYGIAQEPADKHKLKIVGCSEDEITNRSSLRAITPNRLDFAIKSGLTTNKLTLTDDEKASAQQWLGIDTLIGDIGTALDELHTYAQSLVNGGNA